MEQLREVLREHNLRVTSQRELILRVLNDCRGHHLETENIYELIMAKEQYTKKIGLATVYRTMELFKKIGLVSKLAMDNSPARYELMIQEKLIHHHLICLKCGQVQEIEDRLTDDLKGLVWHDKNFKVAEKPMKIYGYCSKCQK